MELTKEISINVIGSKEQIRDKLEDYTPSLSSSHYEGGIQSNLLAHERYQSEKRNDILKLYDSLQPHIEKCKPNDLEMRLLLSTLSTNLLYSAIDLDTFDSTFSEEQDKSQFGMRCELRLYNDNLYPFLGNIPMMSYRRLKPDDLGHSSIEDSFNHISDVESREYENVNLTKELMTKVGVKNIPEFSDKYVAIGIGDNTFKHNNNQLRWNGEKMILDLASYESNAKPAEKEMLINLQSRFKEIDIPFEVVYSYSKRKEELQEARQLSERLERRVDTMVDSYDALTNPHRYEYDKDTGIVTLARDPQNETTSEQVRTRGVVYGYGYNISQVDELGIYRPDHLQFLYDPNARNHTEAQASFLIKRLSKEYSASDLDAKLWKGDFGQGQRIKPQYIGDGVREEVLEDPSPYRFDIDGYSLPYGMRSAFDIDSGEMIVEVIVPSNLSKASGPSSGYEKFKMLILDSLNNSNTNKSVYIGEENGRPKYKNPSGYNVKILPVYNELKYDIVK